MQYVIVAHRGKAIKRGNTPYSDINEAIKKAYEVAKHFKCYCTIERVAAS